MDCLRLNYIRIKVTRIRSVLPRITSRLSRLPRIIGRLPRVTHGLLQITSGLSRIITALQVDSKSITSGLPKITLHYSNFVCLLGLYYDYLGFQVNYLR